MSIAITAPTGHIGSSLVDRLLAANAKLTLLVRNPDKLSRTVRDRVNVQKGELEDGAFVQRATEGCEALFLLAPPNFAAPNVRDYYQGLSKAFVQAVTANSSPRVVFISAGGGGSKNAGLVSEVFHIEAALGETSADVLSLRCGAFMENFMTYLPTLRAQGAFYGLLRPDLPLPMVATQDIAAVAAQKLLDRSWKGKLHLAVHGAADVTSEEAAHIISEATGKTLRYVQVPAEQVEQSLLQMGASPDVAASYVQMMQAYDTGIYQSEPRTAETTTPTTLYAWAVRVLKPALEQAA